ncbi:MAG: S1C family serine protease [Bacillota bacterium]
MDSFNNFNDDNNRPHQYHPQRRRRPSLFSYFAVALAGALIGGFIMAAVAPYYIYGKLLPYPGALEERPQQQLAQQVILNPTDDITVASAVAKKAMPAVVGISTVTVEKDVLGFGRAVEGIGSGVIVHPDGYILTNSHVVTENPRRITVNFMDGTELEGRVLWQEASLDLAVIKVEATGLTAAVLGDSDKLIVGEPAIAIGNPLGMKYERTVTQGIVSGLNRSIWVSQVELMEDLIQTDAAINPGNSGGPLINSRGEVIGINTIKAATAEGLGFAIPINVTKPIINKFIEDGEFIPTYMGIMLLDSEFASIYYPEIELKKGILVTNIVEGGPADKAGLQTEDIITHINDIEVNTMIKFKGILYANDPGTTVTIKFTRDGRQHTTEAVLEEKPEGVR